MQGWNKVAGESDAKLGRDGIGMDRPSRVSILDLVLILLDRKWFLLVGMFAVCGSAVATVLIMESEYTSTTVVLPSKQSMSSPLGSLMGDMPLGGLLKSFDFLGQGDNNEFLSILDSRRLAEKVITRFDLVRHYGFHKKRKYYYENVLKEYHASVKVEEDELSNITIAVTDTNPQVAADIANYIVYQLDTISFQISNESARGSRIFFEARLNLIRHVLDSAHHALADFQVKHNFIDLETQVKATVETLASIEAEAMAMDIQGEMLSSSFGNNSRMVEVKRKKEVLDRRLKSYMKKGSGNLVLALEKTPELGIQYAYLYRDVKINETLYAYILQMYEQAKFREANNSPVVTVLEPAKPAQKRSSPKRGLICILAFFLGFAFLSSWVLISHWYRLQQESGADSYFKLQRLFAHFRPAR
ncbi:MAG: Wzz/FepE/Etk N-terminal domain-containing protein [Fibrobacterota bacterium]|nr:Wzz/FepE/Etk N-terminal domain-containing protein [Fibrobacterota bacterium]